MSRSRQRNITRSLRFTEEEWAAFNAKLGGRDFSCTARAILLGAPIPEPEQHVQVQIIQRKMTEYESKRIQILTWIGNILNQIAMAMHPDLPAIQIHEDLLSLERKIGELEK